MMKISRDLALKILKYQLDNKEFYFPFILMCKEYGTCRGENSTDKDYVEIIAKDDYQDILTDKYHNDFKLQENLQNLHKETIKLMVKGFIEKITQENNINKIESLAKKYRAEWKEELWESENIEKYGFNEFVGGKAEAFEECLNILKLDYEKKENVSTTSI